MWNLAVWKRSTVGAPVGGNPGRLCFSVSKQAHKLQGWQPRGLMGGGDMGAASGVKRAVQREQAWAVQSLRRDSGGGDTLRREAQPKSFEFQPLARNRNHCLNLSLENDETCVIQRWLVFICSYKEFYRVWRKKSGVYCLDNYTVIAIYTPECCSIVGDDSIIICNGAEWGMCFVCMLQKGVLVLFIKTTTAEHAALVSTKHSHYPTV